MSATRVILATRSDGKLRELQAMLAFPGVVVETLNDAGMPESPVEDTLEGHASFEENALAKARWFYAQNARMHDVRAPEVFGTFVIADDSGLVVDALDGAPGVRSKRWSGRADLHGAALDEANNVFLMRALADAARRGKTDRTARYACAAACVWGGGEMVVCGRTEGTLTAAPRGANGFGYDPYFESSDLGMTFAEADRGAKARVSHRGRAMRGLLEQLKVRHILRASGAV